MNNRVFTIADTHFGHKGILGLQPNERSFSSIEEHDRVLVERWNAVVKPKDSVWHLGDVFFTKDGHLPLQYLNGIKRLVMGNHDHYPLAIYQQYFKRICGATEYKGCILTHIPVHPEQLEFRFKLNIHGHLHARVIPSPRYRCVSVEQTGLAPVLLSDILGE